MRGTDANYCGGSSVTTSYVFCYGREFRNETEREV
jgi:hypothetical protein